MPPDLPRLLAELTWEEARAYQALRPVVLVPVGATEAHGPHLPLGTDVILSEELARRAHGALLLRGQAAFIAPTLGYAITEFGAGFAGTVSLSAATATALYADVCAGLQRAGFERVCLVNSHLEPAHVLCLREACAQVLQRTGQPVAFPDHTGRRWARTLTEEYRRGKCHAGRYETALVLASRPELVREEIRELLPENESDFLQAVRDGAQSFAAAGGPLAYFGDPARASAGEGEGIYELLVKMVLTTIEETF